MIMFFVLSFSFVFAASEIDSSFLVGDEVVVESYIPPFINYVYSFIWVFIVLVIIFILFRMKKSSKVKVSKTKVSKVKRKRIGKIKGKKK